MAYRNELAALEMRRAKLLRELDDLSAASREITEKRALRQAELTSVIAALDGAEPRRSLRVANPCTERWDAMQGDERVRFCGACQKHVYNLSAMSAVDVHALLRRESGACTRFYTRPDGTVLTSECPIAGRRRRAKAVVGVVTLMALAGTAANAVLAAGGEVRNVSVGDLLREGSKLLGEPVRMEGTLVHGSLTKQEAPCQFLFRLSGNGREILVRHAACVVPDTFRDVPGLDLPVLVDGELAPDGAFAATSVIPHVAQGYTLKSREPPAPPLP